MARSRMYRIPGKRGRLGRHPGNRGDSAFPQVQAVYLAECGAHAIVDAGFWPCQTSERVGAFRMLRSVTARHARHVGPRLS